MDIISIALGAYLNVSSPTSINHKTSKHLYLVETLTETKDIELEQLQRQCNIETAVALTAPKDDPLLEMEEACGKYEKYKKEYRPKSKKNLS
ncbi:MAG: hypothetical protein COB62_02600 [Piscirickettsiaceae bacterium]|nr:MAG: hypothetical protein COB62_02600 [Piscirickettsiaceae bacterium]